MTLEHIVLPERLSKTSAEAEEEAEEKAKLESVSKDFTLNLERAKKQVNKIQKSHT